jgi:hypothetical protein
MTADEEVKFTLSHQASNTRTRHMARVDQRVIAEDPLLATNEYKTLGCYLVIDEPEYGFTDGEIDYVVQALKTWLSSANVAKILGSEH